MKADWARMAMIIMCRCIIIVGENSVCGGFEDTCETALYFVGSRKQPVP